VFDKLVVHSTIQSRFILFFLSVHFAAALGWSRLELVAEAQKFLVPGQINSILKEESERYAARRPSSKGLFETAPKIIGSR